MNILEILIDVALLIAMRPALLILTGGCVGYPFSIIVIGLFRKAIHWKSYPQFTSYLIFDALA